MRKRNYGLPEYGSEETKPKHVVLAVGKAKLRVREIQCRPGGPVDYIPVAPHHVCHAIGLHDALKTRLDHYGYLKPSLTGIFATYYDSFKAQPEPQEITPSY
jgi:hypothetical protein